MSTALLDELPSETRPVVIRTKAEYSRLLDAAKRLMETPEATLSEEEGRLLELLSIVIEEYEDRVHPLPKAEPHIILSHLLEENNMKPSALWETLPKSRVSEILSGKRSIGKAQAKQLAEPFRMPVEVFL
jgi:HTH-type transcriptional regulator/antitoxin HigA